jgi:hypothetical protein
MPQDMPKEYQNICQIECQKECHKICQIEHLAEAMLVVEDIPILQRINVMVGITRSKVFFVFFHNKVMHGMNMDKSNIQHHNT